jgi:hypothetical protein
MEGRCGLGAEFAGFRAAAGSNERRCQGCDQVIVVTAVLLSVVHVQALVRRKILVPEQTTSQVMVGGLLLVGGLLVIDGRAVGGGPDPVGVEVVEDRNTHIWLSAPRRVATAAISPARILIPFGIELQKDGRPR